MIANYHTHTTRCGHAEGAERDYVACALKAGMKILGFSDHTPHDYMGADPGRKNIRMALSELPDYAETIRALATEYRAQIEIHLGVEAEYYPRLFPRLLELLRGNGVEYMILGQHFLGNELDEPYSGRPTLDEKILRRYVDQTCEAMETGLFTYFAHPDLIRYVGPRAIYERHMRRLCRVSVETGTPLEINLLGQLEGRHYPNERFWRLAAEEGCAVILGCDAHAPEQLCDAKNEEAARKLAARCGLTPMDTVTLRKL